MKFARVLLFAALCASCTSAGQPSTPTQSPTSAPSAATAPANNATPSTPGVIETPIPTTSAALASPRQSPLPSPSPNPQSQTFDGERAYKSVIDQVAFGPRPAGSPALRQLGDQILNELAANGWMTETQEFVYKDTPVRNLVGKKGSSDDVVIIGAHYDTRRRADQDAQRPDLPVPGANDGASGTAALLELSRVLDVDKIKSQVWLVFFDAEDNGNLDGWDWIIGSREFANQLAITPTAVVILDMIGDEQQDIYLERNSNQQVAKELWDVAHRLGYEAQFRQVPKWSMLDDHTPFLERGLRAVDIIDFDYPFWHTTQDTPDKVSPESLGRVGRTVEVWLEGT